MILAYFVIAVLTGLSLWFASVTVKRHRAGNYFDWVLTASACLFLVLMDLMFCLGVVLS
ncbi:conserved protein of unknown function [Pseudomonas marincola]|uniref:Uncharacterized protein n=1 Tax=Pseudomonas marincola TaxID=437900 RepID=A0A653E8W0_9PSED|nr:hypothetical protein [Pseudomonas marincola]CAE6906539.1 conserved protein of unknown function [Pseudomonas marincola]